MVMRFTKCEEQQRTKRYEIRPHESREWANYMRSNEDQQRKSKTKQ